LEFGAFNCHQDWTSVRVKDDNWTQQLNAVLNVVV